MSVDLNTLPLEGPGSLLDLLATIPDPRKRRGIRHSQATLLAVAICAVLSGARSMVAMAEWAADLPQDLLKRLHCRWHPEQQRYIPPSEPTLRRAVESVDVDIVDRKIGEWLAQHVDPEALAVDGKTLRGSGHGGQSAVHLLSAVLHQQGVTLAQQPVDQKENEITRFQPLLDPLPLEGKVVTADALHTQTSHARYLVEEKKADYVFIVKKNQPTLFEDIQSLDPDSFSPSGPDRRQRPQPHRDPDDPR